MKRGEHRPPISGIVITFNEEVRIEACLASLKTWCDDLLVVDSHSTDRTRELALAAGARVIEHDFESHVKQKNVAVDEARHDWILALDADEVLEALDSDPLSEVDFHKQDQIWRLGRRNHYLGAWIRHTSWRRDSSVRLFHRQRARFGGSWVHDSVRGDGCRVQRLKGLRILHWPYRDLQHHVEKINRYTDHLAREMREQGKRPTLVKLVLDPAWKFLRNYLLEGGWRMGARGFVLSAVAAFYVFLKYAKLWEAGLPEGDDDV